MSVTKGLNIGKLIEIAEFAEQDDLVKELNYLFGRLEQSNSSLVLPLVGEFSSGKTTLINALTDSKCLETATKPTTATIYEIFFGCSELKADIINEDGSLDSVLDLSELKNEKLKDAVGVTLFDTSTKVPSSTVLVDTPGLSSPDPKHKQVLIDFMPEADGVLLVSDLNQQITRSLMDFINEMEIAKRPVYLVLTKCDTKLPTERNSVKEYISKNIKLPIERIACVSAKENDLEELYLLLSNIDADKTNILRQANEYRLKVTVKSLIQRIDELLKASSSDSDLMEAVKDKKEELKKLTRNIDTLISDTRHAVKDIESDVCNKFSDSIFEKLESIVVSKNSDYDISAMSAINGTTSLYLEQYKKDIQDTLYHLAEERKNKDTGINIQSLMSIDLNTLQLNSMQYNLNLNELGHGYDKLISNGVKVLAVAGAVVATVATAGAAAGGIAAAGGTVASGAATAGAGSAIAKGVASSVDAIIVAGAMRNSNRKQQEQMQTILKEKMASVDKADMDIGNRFGQKKGIVESVISQITDRVGKPQRQRMIHDYIDSELIPEFKIKMGTVSSEVLRLIHNTLQTEAQECISVRTNAIADLQKQYDESQEKFKSRIEQLQQYKNDLQTAV